MEAQDALATVGHEADRLRFEAQQVQPALEEARAAEADALAALHASDAQLAAVADQLGSHRQAQATALTETGRLDEAIEAANLARVRDEESLAELTDRLEAASVEETAEPDPPSGTPSRRRRGGRGRRRWRRGSCCAAWRNRSRPSPVAPSRSSGPPSTSVSRGRRPSGGPRSSAGRRRSPGPSTALRRAGRPRRGGAGEGRRPARRGRPGTQGRRGGNDPGAARGQGRRRTAGRDGPRRAP
ncbi:hypothetical protein [Tessaracoccus coleopterorum]|uniref:hypothetical protein n=1 Tax=Tessaracoccus coleopterorum TaxID=2714950 RepID=UPI002F90A89D